MYYVCLVLFIFKYILWVNFIIIILQVKTYGKSDVKKEQYFNSNLGNCKKQILGKDNYRKYYVVFSYLVFGDIYEEFIWVKFFLLVGVIYWVIVYVKVVIDIEIYVFIKSLFQIILLISLYVL